MIFREMPSPYGKRKPSPPMVGSTIRCSASCKKPGKLTHPQWADKKTSGARSEKDITRVSGTLSPSSTLGGRKYLILKGNLSNFHNPKNGPVTILVTKKFIFTPKLKLSISLFFYLATICLAQLLLISLAPSCHFGISDIIGRKISNGSATYRY